MIKVVNPDPNIPLWIAASVPDAAAVNPNSIEALLANGLSTLPIKGNRVFNYGPKSLPKNPPDCPVLGNWVFDNFILADEPFEKAFRSLETCVLVNINLGRKLFSSLESTIIFDERFKVTAVLFFVADLNLLSCELDNFTFNVLYWVISFYIKTKYNHDTLPVPFEKSKTVSFTFWILKNIDEPSRQSRFPVKLICRIAFGPASNFYWWLKSIAINL